MRGQLACMSRLMHGPNWLKNMEHRSYNIPSAPGTRNRLLELYLQCKLYILLSIKIYSTKNRIMYLRVDDTFVPIWLSNSHSSCGGELLKR
jgi:hypothetical protein